MTTATRSRTKANALAGLDEREQVWQAAKLEAGQLASELGAKSREAEALLTERGRLVHRDPGLVDHQGNPNPDVKDNPVAKVDGQLGKLGKLGDLQDLRARMDHARKLEESAKQATHDYTASHLDEILAALGPQAEATVAEITRCMGELAEASRAYLGLAQRVNSLKGTVRERQHLRVPALDVGSDLLRQASGDQPPPLPTEVR